MTPEEFRSNDALVSSLRTFLESETGLALRAVLENEEPLDKLADRSLNKSTTKRGLAKQESESASELLAECKTFRMMQNLIFKELPVPMRHAKQPSSRKAGGGSVPPHPIDLP